MFKWICPNCGTLIWNTWKCYHCGYDNKKFK